MVQNKDGRNIFALTSVLERNRVEVLYAENGRDGLRLLEQTPEIDVVLMDVAMPGMNGFEATRQIKSRPNPPRIVMLTSHDIAHYRTAAEDAGADNFVNKADFGTELLPLIDNVLAERAATES